MGVELLDNNTGVLDLTGGSSNEPETKQEPDTALEPEGEGNPEQQVEGSEDTQQDGEQGGATDEESSDSDAATDDDSAPCEFYFNGQSVEVEVPAEVASALEEAGVDSNELLSQLFAKEGDFSLKEETYNKLTEKFGKVMVDGYLNLYKQQNNNTLQSLADKEASDKAQMEQRGTEYADAVGGKEGLESMESYILENFNESQVAAYNAVMESEDHASQLLVISQVKAQMDLADKLANGDKKVNLVGDDSAADQRTASPLDKGYLTADEYQTLIDSDKYWTDNEYMQRVDAARSAGIRTGK